MCGNECFWQMLLNNSSILSLCSSLSDMLYCFLCISFCFHFLKATSQHPVQRFGESVQDSFSNFIPTRSGFFLIWKPTVHSVNFMISWCQGFQRHGKIMEFWKTAKSFSRPGKIMEFEKKGQNHGKIMAFQNKSWKNHGILFFEIILHTTFEIFFAPIVCNWSLSLHIDHRKCSKNHGTFMEKSWNFILGNGWKPWMWKKDCSE